MGKSELADARNILLADAPFACCRCRQLFVRYACLLEDITLYIGRHLYLLHGSSFGSKSCACSGFRVLCDVHCPVVSGHQARRFFKSVSGGFSFNSRPGHLPQYPVPLADCSSDRFLVQRARRLHICLYNVSSIFRPAFSGYAARQVDNRVLQCRPVDGCVSYERQISRLPAQRVHSPVIQGCRCGERYAVLSDFDFWSNRNSFDDYSEGQT